MLQPQRRASIQRRQLQTYGLDSRICGQATRITEKLDRGQITEPQGEHELSDLANRIWAEQWR